MQKTCASELQHVLSTTLTKDVFHFVRLQLPVLIAVLPVIVNLFRVRAYIYLHIGHLQFACG